VNISFTSRPTFYKAIHESRTYTNLIPPTQLPDGLTASILTGRRFELFFLEIFGTGPRHESDARRPRALGE